jgi:F-type H+-transporting ATPase subunit epsilon
VNKLKVKIVTPKREMYNGEADMVIFRSKCGDVGIMHGHLPMVTVLDYGVLRLMENGEAKKFATVFGGFAEVDGEGVNILTDAAEWTDEIDLQRAQEAKERAEKRLLESGKSVDEARAELALKRAIIRINAVNDK